MKITTKDAASALGVSNHKLHKANRILGLEKGYSLHTSDMEKLKEVVERKIRTGGKKNPNFPDYYDKALIVIKKDGYITNYDLIKIFQVDHIVHVEAYFEARNNPLYDDKIPMLLEHKRRNHNYKQKDTRVWRLLNPLFEEWRQDAKTVNGYSNNYVGNMTGRLF